MTDRMAQLLDDIPDGYTAGFSFTVADDEGYSAEQILEGINDALTFRHLRYLRETVRNGFRIGLLFAPLSSDLCSIRCTTGRSAPPDSSRKGGVTGLPERSPDETSPGKRNPLESPPMKEEPYEGTCHQLQSGQKRGDR